MFDAVAQSWTTMSFAEAVEINPRRLLPKDGKVPFLDMASLPLNGAPVSVVDEREVATGGSRFKAGDTLFARITPCAENGKLGFVQSTVGGGVAQGSTEFIVMAAREGVTIPEYVRFLAGWSEVRDRAIGLMEGTSGRQRVPSWAFDEIEISIPPVEEQRQIAEILCSAELLVAAQEAVIAKLRAVQSATFASFLRTGDSCEQGVEVSDWVTGRIEGVTRLPPGWKIVRLIDVAKLESGHTPSRNEPAYWANGNIGWISLHDTQNLERPEIIESEIMITPEGVKNSSARILPKGTVCFSRTATVGKCVIMGREMATSQDFANFICSDSLNNRYLLYLMRWMQPVWKQLASGSTHKTIYMPTFKSLQIVLPPRRAQDEIATAMDALTDAIESGLATLDQQRRIRSALAGDLLSGCVRVPA